ncbi:hypothetical protein B0O99DRAFT_610808 [Bisporella sp. PMI_857]|nr:hypothetical protein B0O99DRAFT_610808 [Bisporella sp. PMI_857]
MPATEAFPVLDTLTIDKLSALAGPNTYDNINKGAEAERDRKKPFSKRRKARNLFQQWKRYALKHTWVTPLVLLLIFLVLYAINPTPSNPIHCFIFLSYPVPGEPWREARCPNTLCQRQKGYCLCIILRYCTIICSGVYYAEISAAIGAQKRTEEQGKAVSIHGADVLRYIFWIYWSLGLYVMSRSPMWYFNTTGMYEGFPHKTNEGPRKDFKELIGHHIVTLALIGLSYRFHFTHMGLGYSLLMISTSKTLNYLDHPLVGPYFALFIGVWIYLRHYLNLVILWSEFNEFKTVGPYILDWEAEQYKCNISHWISTALLSTLQALNLFWLYYIIRIAYRFVFRNELEDDRSDNDDNEFAEEQKLDALARQGLENGANQKVVANGHSSNGKATSSQGNAQTVTNRKENKAKA